MGAKAIISIFGKDAAGDIKILAMPPSDWGKYASFNDANTSVVKSGKRNQKTYNRELVYFYSVSIDGLPMVLQLLNPGFDSKIRIHYDPFASSTTGWGGVGGDRYCCRPRRM